MYNKNVAKGDTRKIMNTVRYGMPAGSHRTTAHTVGGDEESAV
jgi:hypothetical protein